MSSSISFCTMRADESPNLSKIFLLEYDDDLGDDEEDDLGDDEEDDLYEGDFDDLRDDEEDDLGDDLGDDEEDDLYEGDFDDLRDGDTDDDFEDDFIIIYKNIIFMMLILSNNSICAKNKLQFENI
jgi:hypothetical protein